MNVALPGAGPLERHLIGDLLKRARVIGRQTVGIQHGGRSAKERCKEHAYGQIGAVVTGVGVVFAPQVKGRIPYGKSKGTVHMGIEGMQRIPSAATDLEPLTPLTDLEPLTPLTEENDIVRLLQ